MASRLHYTTYFRQYDPRLGRWWSNDPVVQAGESPYAAMFNNPILFTDPFGDCPGCEDPNTLPEGTTRKVGDDEYSVSVDPEGRKVWSDVIKVRAKRMTVEEVAASRLKREGENPNLPPIPTQDRADLETYLSNKYPDYITRNLVRQNLTGLDVGNILTEMRYGNVSQNMGDIANIELETLGPQDVYRDAYTWPGKLRPGQGYIPVLSDAIDNYEIIFTGQLNGQPVSEAERERRAYSTFGYESATPAGFPGPRLLKAGAKVESGLINTVRLTEVEIATGRRFEQVFGIKLTESPHIGAEYIDEAGKTYDALGNPRASMYWNEEEFLNSIDGHLLKSNDFTVIDLTGFTNEQIGTVRSYINSLPTSSQARILKVGF